MASHVPRVPEDLCKKKRNHEKRRIISLNSSNDNDDDVRAVKYVKILTDKANAIAYNYSMTAIPLSNKTS